MTAEKAIRAVIVDDEKLARAAIRDHLAAHPDVEIAAECANGFEAVKAITELRPELLFLDVQMPKLDGFEVLELAGAGAAVIFVTAYDQYAIKAFEVHAVDYLLKPFTAARFNEALARALGHLARKEFPAPATLARAVRPPEARIERVLIRNGSDVFVIPVGAIDYIEAQDDYVAVVAGGKRHLKQQPLSELETLLDTKRFVRIHRSFILNIERLSKIELYAKDSRVAILKDGTQLPVSRAGNDKLKSLL
jgi:two-component system LytT family response regulator